MPRIFDEGKVKAAIKALDEVREKGLVRKARKGK